jgi:hypothetical protein
MKKAEQRGKRVNLYLRDSDFVKVRELALYAMQQGERTSDSLIFRAALMAATPGKAFMNALSEVSSGDMRFKREE